MSRYFVTVPASVVQEAFAGIDVILPLQEESATVYFGYDYPLAIYFLDVEDGMDFDGYHEFGYGSFVPGTRLTRGQILDVLGVLICRVSSGELVKFRNAIVMDLPV